MEINIRIQSFRSGFNLYPVQHANFPSILQIVPKYMYMVNLVKLHII